MRLTVTLFSKTGYWSTKYSNLPERYVKRAMRQVYWETPRGKPQYLRRTLEKTDFYFSLYRPWTNAFRVENQQNKRPVIVEPILKWSFFRGDRVEVLTGKDKGKQGIVKDIYQERNWVIVQGLNTKLKCLKESKDPNEVLYAQIEQPLLVTTQVRLVDPFDLKSTDVEWRYTEQGECVRVSCRTGRLIPIPVSNEETIDYKLPNLYQKGTKDTSADDVYDITFEAALKTFEMDIMDRMGIKEDRVPKKYYWY